MEVSVLGFQVVQGKMISCAWRIRTGFPVEDVMVNFQVDETGEEEGRHARLVKLMGTVTQCGIAVPQPPVTK